MAGVKGDTATKYNAANPVSQNTGAKGGGVPVNSFGKPALTTMKTPIVYGKSYVGTDFAPLSINKVNSSNNNNNNNSDTTINTNAGLFDPNIAGGE
jgi:hypothetical protein